MSLNKTDLAFKKLINRQFTTPNRAFYQEVGANTLEIDSGMVYTSTISASRAAAISASVVRIVRCVLTKDYSGTVSTSSYYMISGSGYSVDASNYNANFTSLGANFFTISSSYVQRNFLSEKYGSQYIVEVRDSSGTQLSSDSSINWYFDYKSGVLHVADPSPSILPYSITASQYIGSFLSDAVLDESVGTPEMYGALGDGVTDDQSAIHHALISHSVVELGARTYAIRGWMGMPSHRIFRGKGKDVTTLKLMDNSPYGYSGQLYLIEGTFQQNTLYWYGSSVGTTTGTGSIDVDHRDTTIRDQSPLSPFYRQEQTQSWAGLGYWSYDSAYGGLVGARKDVTIENMTIDCNFNNQARHVSWNHSDNPSSASNGGSGYYIPQYNWKVRPTIHAIVLAGENIRVDNVKVINYGYGVSHASAGPINYSNIDNLPIYNENFPILITGNRNASYTSSNTNDPISDVQGNSKFRGNYVTNTEILGMGNLDLMNPVSNTTAIVCNNHAVFADGVYKSTFPNEGGIYNCTVDPGEYVMPATASFRNGVYLDTYLEQSRSLSGSYPSLFEKLVYDPVHSQTGSNGDFALSYGSAGIYSPYLKKISGSWYPAGNSYSTNRHIVNAYCGFRVFNCVARNVAIGFYHDSWMGNYFIENNQFLDVDNGFRTVVSDIILTSSYKNVVFKNNYVKLAAHNRAYVPGHSVVFYGIDRSVGSGSLTRHIDNLVIEDNIFELPISSSTNIYGLGKFAFREYPRYVGVWFASETSPSGSYPHLHRGVSLKNNSFVNWNPTKTPIVSAAEAYGYNLPIYFSYNTSSIETDPADGSVGPFPLSVAKFNREVLPQYIIEGNTYIDSTYPSTASLVPITLGIVGSGNSFYNPINQVKRLSSFTSISGSISALFATGSLQGSSSYALTSSYALNAPNLATGSKYNITSSWATSSVSSSYALTSSYALNAPNLATGSTYFITSSWATSSVSSSYALTASFALNAPNLATGSKYNITSSWATSSVSSSYALTSSYALNGGSGGISSSYALTASYALNGGSGGISSSYALTSSFAQSASYALTSSFAQSARSSSFAQSASYSLNAGSGYQLWASSSVIITFEESGSLLDEAGNPVGEESLTSSFIYYTGSVSIGTADPPIGYGTQYELYVSRSVKIDGDLNVQGGISASFFNINFTQSAQVWTPSSVIITFEESGSLLDEAGNPVGEESLTSSFIYSTSSVSIGTADPPIGYGTQYELYVSRSVKIDGDLNVQGGISSSFFKTPDSSSVVVDVTGSMFYSGSNLFIFTGDGTAGGLVGWKTASLGG